MRYRPLGKTGMNVSEIGLGCEGFLNFDQEETDACIRKAVENGINFMDFYSSDPEAHKRVGKAIRPYRNRFHFQIHMCSAWKDGQYYATRDLETAKTAFKQTMEEFGFDYVDVAMLHYVDSLETFNKCLDNGIIAYLRELKDKGIARSVGLSSHNPEVALKAVREDLIDVLMFSINPCYDLQPADEDVEKLWASEAYDRELLNMEPLREELYELCLKKGVGISVMKAFGGGDLLDGSQSPAKVALTPDECIAYALDRPAVASICCGIRSMEDLERSIAYEEADSEEKDYARALASFPKISWEEHCMYCSHCAPCSAGISVADLTKLLNLARAQSEVAETVREHYKDLKAHAGDCIECGVCETRCPFKVDIIGNMREARNIFGY